MDRSICGSTDTTDGDPCQRVVSGGGRCFLHGESGPPEDHGAPEENVNAVKHGLFAEETERVVESLDPLTEIVAYGLFEESLGQSRYQFNVEYREHSVALGDSEVDVEDIPLPTDSDGCYRFLIPVPQRHLTAASALWTAAIMELQRAEIALELKRERLQRTTVTRAQLDDDGGWITIEEHTEHYLCHPFSRLCRDMADLHELGGLPVDEGDGDRVDTDTLADLPFG